MSQNYKPSFDISNLSYAPQLQLQNDHHDIQINFSPDAMEVIANPAANIEPEKGESKKKYENGDVFIGRLRKDGSPEEGTLYCVKPDKIQWHGTFDRQGFLAKGIKVQTHSDGNQTTEEGTFYKNNLIKGVITYPDGEEVRVNDTKPKHKKQSGCCSIF